MNFKVSKKDVPLILEELLIFKLKVSEQTKKINYLYEFPNMMIEWADRKGFVSLGLYGTIVEMNHELYDRDIEQHKKTLQSFSKYQELFREEFRKIKDSYEKK